MLIVFISSLCFCRISSTIANAIWMWGTIDYLPCVMAELVNMGRPSLPRPVSPAVSVTSHQQANRLSPTLKVAVASEEPQSALAPYGVGSCPSSSMVAHSAYITTKTQQGSGKWNSAHAYHIWNEFVNLTRCTISLNWHRYNCTHVWVTHTVLHITQ